MNTNITLRNYTLDSLTHIFYKNQHSKQSLSYVEEKLKLYSTLDKKTMSMSLALSLLDDFIDPSDPDVNIPNSTHAYQTAERIRKVRPNDYELQIVGLIHDIGKVLFKFGEPNYSVVGDTYVVGCQFPKSIVYYDTLQDNPDFNNPQLNTKLGIYSEKCGLENLKISFGHDEYLYLVLKNNTNHFLPERYWNIIRFHSLYPWHTGSSYREFMTSENEILLQEVLDFNKYDLYSKEDTDFILTPQIKEYYENLLQKFFPEELKW